MSHSFLCEVANAYLILLYLRPKTLQADYHSLPPLCLRLWVWVRPCALQLGKYFEHPHPLGDLMASDNPKNPNEPWSMGPLTNTTRTLHASSNPGREVSLFVNKEGVWRNRLIGRQLINQNRTDTTAWTIQNMNCTENQAVQSSKKYVETHYKYIAHSE